MDSEGWTELGSVVVNVLALPENQRAHFLDEVCGSNEAMRTEVESMLEAYSEAPAYFDSLGEGLVPQLDDMSEMSVDGSAVDPYQFVGKEVGPYHVLDHLGGGGMGVVYKAEDTRLKRPVALKFLPPFLSHDQTARARFMQEARAASALDHPNICTVYEVNETAAGQFYIAMAFYEGETLKQKVSHGALPIDVALDYAIQVSEGLVQAHKQGIVHRDIKPANVMVAPGDRLKILDFGLAKLMGSAQITQTGTTLGTVSYMAPEQARGEAVDHRADIWALGVVLYEMLAGQRPFTGDYQQAIIYNLQNVEPQPVTGLRTGVPMQLSRLVTKALAKSPTDRYQRMADLLDDLRAVQQRKEARSAALQDVLPEHTSVKVTPETTPPARDEEPGPIKILAVDDEPELELLIRQKFRKKIHGNEWAFVFATDGFEALEALQADPDIALVLTDLNMPGMDGLTLLARIQELKRPIKSVVVSAYGDMENIRTAMNRGAFDFVTKPINFEDLETTIQKTRQDLIAYRKAAEAQRQLVSMQKELEVARRIQEAILPDSFPRRSDIDLYAFTSTARDVSGTFYDYFLIGEKQVGFLIGDVAGKGVSAALFMAMSQTFLKGIAQRGEDPGVCLTTMNQLLFTQGFPDLAVTVFYGLLDLETGDLAYGNAGHPTPYLLREPGSIVPLMETEKMPVWHQREHVYPTHHVSLQQGEGLFLFTKGVTDAVDRHGHIYSSERLAALLRDVPDATPTKVIRAAIRGVMQFADDVPLADDVTVLALRYQGR